MGEVDRRVLFVTEWTLKLLRLKPDIGIKMMNADHIKTVVNDFLEKENITTLIVYALTGNQLVAETAFPANPKSKWVYFVKRKPCVIPRERFEHLMMYGDMPCAFMEAYKVFINKVLIPILCNDAINRDWPTAVTKDIKHQLHDLRTSVEHVCGLVVGKPVLALPQGIERIDAAVIQANERGEFDDEELMLAIELVANKWIQLVEHLIQQESSYPITLGLNPGPMTEINFWNKRKENLGSICQQFYSPEVSKVTIVLEKISSSYYPALRNTILDAEKALVEAKDISRHLNPLRFLFEALENSEFTELYTTLRPLIHVVCMAWSKSKYYCTTPKIIVLLQEIANELVNQARAFIDPATIFQLEVPEGLEKIQRALGLFDQFKSLFESQKKHIAFYFPGREPLQWDFPPQLVFAKTDVFIERLHVIEKVFETACELMRLEKMEIGNRLGRILSSSIAAIYVEFTEAYVVFANRTDDTLDTENKKFLTDCKQLMDRVEDWDRRLGCIITLAFDDCNNPESAFKLLAMVTPLLDRPIIKKDCDLKYPRIVMLLAIEMQRAREIYDKHTNIFKSTGVFPTCNNLPPVSGRLMWVHQLRERISAPMGAFQLLEHPIVSSDEAKAVFKKYRDMMAALDRIESSVYSVWKQSVGDICRTYLRRKLLIRDEESQQISVNFDGKLSVVLKEVKYMLVLERTDIPLSAASLYECGHDLNELVYALKQTALAYNRLKCGTLPVVFAQIQKQLSDIDTKLHPAEHEHHWLTKDVWSYVVDTKNMVECLDAEVKKCECNIEEIRTLLSAWNQAPLFRRKDGKVDTLLTLEDRPEKIKKRFAEISAAKARVDAIIAENRKLLQGSDDSDTWQDYLDYIDDEIKVCTKDMILCSLYYILDNTNPQFISSPLYEVRLVLDCPEVIFMPPLDDKYINGLMAVFQQLISDILDMCLLTPTAGRNKTPESLRADMKNLDEVREIAKEIERRTQEVIKCGQNHATQFEKYNSYYATDMNAFLARFVKFGRRQKSSSSEKPAELVRSMSKQINIPVDETEQGSPPQLEDFRNQIDTYKKVLDEADQIIDIVIFDKWFRVDIKPFKYGFMNLLNRWVLMFKTYLMDHVVNSLNELDAFIKTTEEGLSHPLVEGNYDDLVAVMRHLLAARARQGKTDEMFEPLKETVDLLRTYNLEIPEDIHVQLQELPEKWNSTKKLVAIVKQQVVPLQTSEVLNINRKCAAFEEEIMQYKDRFKTYSFYNPNCLEPYVTLNMANAEVREMEDEVCRLQEAAGLFEVNLTDFKHVRHCRRDIRLLKHLWDYILMIRSSIEEWKKTPWSDIDIEQMDLECKKFAKDVRGLDKEMKSWDAYVDLELRVKNLLTSLRAVSDLQNHAIRERHWDQLMHATGVQFIMDGHTTLADLLALNLHNYEDEVRCIVDKAVKEMSMEKVLKELNATWSVMEFEHEHHPRTGCQLLKASEDLIAVLEDNQVQMQNLLTSKYISHFLAEISKWQKKLSAADQVITVWLEVQRTWLHLESIFTGSEDLRKQLPDDTDRFDSVDKQFRLLLLDTNQCKNAIEATNKPGLYQKLEKLQQDLILCEKALAQYLDTKRLAFPRFYFVSSADLLDILSNGSQPKMIMRHLVKLFDSLANLKFKDDTCSQAVGMFAKDGEYVEFFEECNCVGQVEVWLNRLLEISITSMRHYLELAVFAYEEKPREQWLFEYPAQVALCGTQVWWTAEVNNAFARLEDGFDNALKDYYKKQIQQLNTLITMLLGELSSGDRQKIMTICTVDVHARDVVGRMVTSKVENGQAFLWQSQLRHRWDDVEKDCFSNICDAEFRYCYEYLGNTPRLVITPLTDRCYITLTQSLHLIMGGGPAGPAGTGKTETTKDLGRALGMMVYVFNCSEQMDYKSCESLYKGLAQTGAWGCFDEFNRISVEVLSVVAVQVKSILDAIRDKRKTFYFSGEEIPINPTVGMFITMNPGYAGRTELPENVKALFRPCAMVTPDFELICEIMLVAEGFLDAKKLARKFITLYTLCKELLSKQDHYDWGLRAIKSVLVVAGSLKRSDPGRPEDQVLMRALRDFNIPKIITEDIPVFMGLIGDLFPSLDVPRKRDHTFEGAVRDACISLKLQPEDQFILKIVQLAELLNVRHSVFIIGNAGTGKTNIWKTLLKTYQNMNMKPIIHDLNPKAVTNDELFGVINRATREWKDGLFSNLMRELANAPGDGPKWIMLDGDIDPMWIESLNTVMDDNKVLTLASNERISLSPSMRLLFEISSLRCATPATVSRAGILYINPQDLGWGPYVSSWLDRRTGQSDKANLMMLFDKYVPTLLDTLRSRFKKITPVQDISHIQMLCYLLECLLTPEDVPPDSSKDIYELYFVFCCVWAFGAALFHDQATDNRLQFSKWWNNEFKVVKFPAQGTVFDYFIDPETKKFLPWTEKVPRFELDPERPLQSTLVHTAETIRLHYFVNLLLQNQRPVLLVGNAGCGKTVLVNELLADLPDDQYVIAKVPFNFYTTSEMLQRVLEKALEKKAGRNYGPPGNKRMIYFIDDMNMPEVDPYDTVQPHTLIRQHLDYGHWYDRAKLTLKDIHCCQYVSCMNPTAGSFTISQRLQRHFSVFAVSFPSAAALQTIYNSIFSQHLASPILKFPPFIQQMSAGISATVLGLHQKVSQCFLPTASKFHYVFNLRDLSSLFQGLLFITPDCAKTQPEVLRMLIHETRRVYQDKLVDEKDMDTHNKILRDAIKKNFEEFDETILHEKPLVYCHFAKGMGEPKYMPISTWGSLSKLLDDALRGYNEINSAMNLVLFEDAMQHVCRINRILESPQGNALLVGVGGSGKQSLARLAAYISSLEVAQITIKTGYNLQDFMNDLAQLHIKAGLKNVGTVFLMTDAQVSEERFLVLINDLLASGEIADLFPDDEVDNIVSSLRSEVKAAGIVDTKENCWKFFIDRVRRQLRVVLCFSPVGETLRARSRKFPAIINCTCIDWFHEWPQEALVSVSQRFLNEVDVLPKALTPAISTFMAFSHISVNEMSKTYLQSDKRYNYTTPKSFLEQIALYINLINKKNKDLQGKIERLENGLQKLRQTASQVDDLKAKLAVQEVELKQKNDDADKLIQIVAQETLKVTEEKAIAATEGERVAEINIEVSKKQQDCEADLVKAEPALLAAQEALNTLNKNNLTELKSFGSPPSAVTNVTSAVMVLMAPGGKIPRDRSWKAAKINMAKVDQFLDDLIKFDKENIHPEVLKAIRPYLDDPEFNPEFIRSKSGAAAGLCSWVINIVKFYEIFCEVEPKRLALQEANNELSTAQNKLASIREKILQLEEALSKLTTEFEKATGEKMCCQREAEKTYKTIELANRLIGGLASEKIRWAESVAGYRQQEKTLPGDVLLISAFISYVGCFTKQYRVDLMEKKWLPYLHQQDCPLPITEGLDFIALLTDDAQIALWNNEGLPNDRMSTENATILSNSERWPLMIDPQLQGVKWIKNKYKDNLTVIQLGQKGCLDKIEDAVKVGMVCLIENIGEAIDPVLDPLLGRNTIKKGTAIIIGDKEVEYNQKFRLILHSKLANPHYKPELQAQTTLINFTVTQDGLEDQLLAEVVNKERPELETMKDDLTTQQNDFKIALKELEDSLLHRLSMAQGNFLGDSALVENLETTKKTATEISVKVVEAKKTEQEINQARELYRPAAARASVLYFILNDLCKINPIYQFSLKAFKVVFNKAIERAEPSDVVTTRVNNLIDCITYSVFLYTTRGLFEQDKLIFTVQMAFQILMMNSEINPEELDFLLRYPTQPNVSSPVDFLSNQSWGGIKALANLEEFRNLDRDIEGAAKRWQKFVESECPEKEKFPQEWKNKSSLQNLCMLRALRPDRMTCAITDFVEEKLGKKYVQSRSVDLAKSLEESGPATPFFFILSPGVDPLKDVEILGRKQGYSADNKNFHSVSLGQGQEVVAEAALEHASKSGQWVILQNIHLVKAWLPKLEKKMEAVSESSHPDFRVFLSAEPAKTAAAHIIPQGILESAIKITNEPPRGIKANLHKALDNFNQETLEMCTKEAEFKSILFSLCYFHAVISERNKFGPQGWNKLYPFNTGDLQICVNVLHNYLENSSRVPWEDLRYLFGEIMYGGHVTDHWDSKLCRAYLEEYLRPEQLEGELFLAPDFACPPNMDYGCYHQYIDEVLPGESPYLYGLHPNAEIGFLTATSDTLFRTVLELQPRNAGGQGGVVVTREEKVKQVLDDITEKLPEEFNMAELSAKVEEKTPYSVVALQECERMNTLIGAIRRSLRELDLGLKGELTITSEMERVSNSLYLDQIPQAWAALAYPSMLGLGAWYADLLMRFKEMETWTNEFQMPAVVWLTGFFNPQSFLTAIMQSTARKNEMPLDKMCLQVDVTKKNQEDFTTAPREGAYIHGLFMEGARWDVQGGIIVDPRLKELHPTMPVIFVKAIHVDKQDMRSMYECPVYKTRERGNTFVWTFNLKTKEKASKWVLAGVALLLQV